LAACRFGFEALRSTKVPAPRIRVAMKMHHGNNQNFIPLNCVNDSVGKAVCPAASNVIVQCEPRGRVDENARDGGPHFLKKIMS
jgi:hypothetical protein